MALPAIAVPPQTMPEAYAPDRTQPGREADSPALVILVPHQRWWRSRTWQ